MDTQERRLVYLIYFFFFSFYFFFYKRKQTNFLTDCFRVNLVILDSTESMEKT